MYVILKFGNVTGGIAAVTQPMFISAFDFYCP